jgi:hypothetical protein
MNNNAGGASSSSGVPGWTPSGSAGAGANGLVV